MSDLRIDTTFSRRDLIVGGALVVGFSFTGGLGEAALAARGDAAGPPDPNTIDTWIAVHADNTATIYLGKGEFGQGNTTGLLQIAGEELDLDMSQLKWVQLDTNVTPNQGATTSSLPAALTASHSCSATTPTKSPLRTMRAGMSLIEASSMRTGLAPTP